MVYGYKGELKIRINVGIRTEVDNRVDEMGQNLLLYVRNHCLKCQEVLCAMCIICSAALRPLAIAAFNEPFAS